MLSSLAIVVSVLVAAPLPAEVDASMKLEAQAARLEQDAAQVATRHQAKLQQLERLKAQPAGVARDLQLQTALREAKELADTMGRSQGALAAKRRELLATCDRALRAPGVPGPRRAQLVELRARTAQRLAGLGGGAPRLGVARAKASPDDGPEELREKADLLEDSEDKVRRQVALLERRLLRMQDEAKLRELAHRSDDDLFGEAGSSRRAVRGGERGEASGAFDRSSGGAPAPAAPPPSSEADAAGDSTGATGGAGDPAAPTFSAVLRDVLDPSTLDELRRSERGGDAATRARALARAREQLRHLADDLAGQAGDLRRREQELRRQGK